MPTDNLILTPTYQAPLIEDLKAIMRRAMDATPHQTWKALATLYHFLPPECAPECKAKFDEIQQSIKDIPNNLTGDPVMAASEIQRMEAAYLLAENLLFLQTIKDSLFKHGYLRSDFTVRPTYGSGKI